MSSRTAAVIFLNLLVTAGCASTPQQPQQRRALLISLDALSESRALALPREIAPNLHALFEGGACAAYAVPSFPSVTAAGHAAIATGAWGNINGVSANSQPMLPRDRNRLTATESGYAAGPLRAEPIWITAALAGRDVVSHHFTQAPQSPGYRPLTSERAVDVQPQAVDNWWPEPVEVDSSLVSLRERADRALAMPGVAVMNGYNRVFTRGIVVSQATSPTGPALGWTGLDALPAGTMPPLEASWQVLDDSVFVIFYGVDRYTNGRMSLTRDAAAGVAFAAMPADTTSPANRPLARYFSDPLELASEGGRVFLRARLFELSPDGSEFLLFHPALGMVETNRPDVDAEYDAAVSGWAGNGAFLMSPAGFGRALVDGGDGTAEARYLESLEYATRQFMAGAEWGWRQRNADLLVDYFPVGDEIDHNMYGWLAPATPGHDPALAARYAPFRNRAWQLVDMRLGHLKRMVEGDAGAALFVTGDHGMRPYWRVFRANTALREAGLLALDADNRVDLTRTRALTPTGAWISVNHTGWRDGIVAQDSIDAVINAAERALLAARGPDGEQVVVRTWRVTAETSAELGIGGPVAGDLYFELAPGYYYSSQPAGDLTSSVRPNSGHGFPSTAPDMHTALCGWGDAMPHVRTGGARIIDAAPTVAEWLGIPAPPQATGTSILGEWMRRD